jgi:hypothetical protein
MLTPNVVELPRPGMQPSHLSLVRGEVSPTGSGRGFGPVNRTAGVIAAVRAQLAAPR